MSEEPRSPVRLFMVDDHPAVREGLRLLLEQEGIAICGEAGDSAAALREIPASSPDLVMVDLSLGRESGLVLLRELARSVHKVPLLVYSMHEDAFHIGQALAAGASGYATKREISAVLAQAIRELLAGRRYVSPRARDALGAVPPGQQKPEPLSPREIQIYQFLGEGYSTAGIAEELGVSRRTVDSYYARILDKLDASGMEDLRRRAAADRLPE
ncbi:MAG: response regulator transcription factor [Acidobacteriota bacterium]